MKKWLCAALVLCLLLPAQAAGPSAPRAGREAALVLCRASAVGRFPQQRIRMVVTLWRGEAAVASWTAWGHGEVRLVRSCAATDGADYRLTVRAAAPDAAPAALTTAACAVVPAGPEGGAGGGRSSASPVISGGSRRLQSLYIAQSRAFAPRQGPPALRGKAGIASPSHGKAPPGP